MGCDEREEYFSGKLLKYTLKADYKLLKIRISRISLSCYHKYRREANSINIIVNSIIQKLISLNKIQSESYLTNQDLEFNVRRYPFSILSLWNLGIAGSKTGSLHWDEIK